MAGRIYSNALPSTSGVVFSHGLFSSMDGYKITSLADTIVQAGYTLLTFNFSFAGGAEEKADLSIIQEIDDLRSAVSFFSGTGIKQIHLMGSSMGGLVSLLYASGKNPVIHSLMLIATPVLLDRLAESALGPVDINTIPDDGMTAIDGITIKNRFFKELISIPVLDALRSISVPVLILQGELDAVVSMDNARVVADTLSSLAKLVIIPHGDHSLTDDASMDVIRTNIIAWLRSFM